MKKHFFLVLLFFIFSNYIYGEKIAIFDIKNDFFLIRNLSGFTTPSDGSIFSKSGIIGSYKILFKKNNTTLCKAEWFTKISNNKSLFIEIKKIIKAEKVSIGNFSNKNKETSIPKKSIYIDNLKFVFNNGFYVLKDPINFCKFKNFFILNDYIQNLRTNYGKQYNINNLNFDLVENNKKYFSKNLKNHKIICIKNMKLIAITIINVSALEAIFASFVVAVTAFVVIGGTLLGILWILPYIKPLFKKDAMGMSA
jgi:hypothetical protein